MSQSNESSAAAAEQRDSAVEGAPRPTRPPRNQRRAEAPQQEPGQQEPRQQQQQQRSSSSPEKPGGRKDKAGKQQADAAPEPRKLSLRELFAPSADDADTATGETPKNWDELVRRSKLTPEQLDEMELTIEGVGPLKFKDLRAKAGQVGELEVNQLRFDQRRIRQEGELMRAQAELRELVAMIPPNQISPKLVDAVRRRHEATVNSERELTLEHIPEWTKDSVRSQDLAGMRKFASNYGFPESWLDTVTDHRALKMMRDAYLTRQMIDKALAEVTVPQEKGQPGSAKGTRSAAKPSVERSSRKAGMRPTQRDNLMNIFNRSKEN